MAYVRPKVINIAGKTPDELAAMWDAMDDATFEAVRAAIEMDRQYQSFKVFAQAFWDVAEPTAKAVWGRHMDVICDEIQATIEESDRRRVVFARIMKQFGKDVDGAAAAVQAELGCLPPLRVVFLIPPRNSKSTIVQRLLPAWRWLHRPADQILALSGVDTLIERDGLALRDIVKSDQYKRIQAHLLAKGLLPRPTKAEKGVEKGQSFGLRADQFAKEKLQNTAGGVRAGHVLAGKYTGVNSDVTVIDDPHDVQDGLDETSSEATKQRLMLEVSSIYKDKVQDRLNSPIWGVIILIMQRVHPDDLANYMINRGAQVVCLPARYDPTHPHKYEKDWREPGEPLNPLRFPLGALEDFERESPHGYATKQMMRPTIAEGIRFRRAWFTKRYDEDPHEAAARCDEVVLSVDCANKTGAKNDYTSMGIWGRKGAKRILLARRYFKAELPGVLAMFDALVAEWPEATLKLVEDKANGTSLIQMRRDTVPGIVPINPKGDKESRANFASAAYEAGNVWLPKEMMVEQPDGSFRNEIEGYVENMVGFGAGGTHDDDVDMTSQVFERWATGAVPWLRPEMREHLAQPRPGLTMGPDVVRWERKHDAIVRLGGGVMSQAQTLDPHVHVYVGIVPGWCTGRPGQESVAAIVDQRGVQLALVEVSEGGIPAFVESLFHEVAHWGGEVTMRYAELPGMPAVQVARMMLAKGMRVGPRAQTSGAYKYAGEVKAGYLGDKHQAPAMWATFLEALSQQMAILRDTETLRRLETVVETKGMPTMPDGSPVNGRVLAFLLAVEAAQKARPKAEIAETERTMFRIVQDLASNQG